MQGADRQAEFTGRRDSAFMVRTIRAAGAKRIISGRILLDALHVHPFPPNFRARRQGAREFPFPKSYSTAFSKA